jgi:potassium inwardly-rectifying channel subfamily J
VIDRKVAFGQSRGRWAIRRVASEHAQEVRCLYYGNPFHTFVDSFNLAVHVLVFGAVYVSFVVLFAFAYLSISEQCSLQLDGDFVKAFYLSLETLRTIGYGVPDPYFDGCCQGVILLTVQAFVGLFLEAVIIGSFFARLSNPETRAQTILFSDKAVIQERDGVVQFLFQVYDLKRHDLVDARVRCYCFHHGTSSFPRCVPMKVQDSDEAGGTGLLLALPTKVVHRIDALSPLAPPTSVTRADVDSVQESDTTSRDASPPRGGALPHTSQVHVLSEQSAACLCWTCGSSFTNMEQLRKHVAHRAERDREKHLAAELCHSVVEDVLPSAPTRSAVRRFAQDHHLEVVVLVEGVEGTTGSTVQSRHSYLIPEDIGWDMDFAECVDGGAKNCVVNLDKFHRLIPLMSAWEF